MNGIFSEDTKEMWQRLADDCAVNRPSKGKHVLVIYGKHAEKEGIVTWHGIDQYASTRYKTGAQLHLRDLMGRSGFRVRIDTGTENFFIDADKVDVIKSAAKDETN